MSPASRKPNDEPRPLLEAELTEIEGLVCDLDDTLTRDGTLEAEALGALHRAKQAGLRLVLVTGRPLGWTDALARLLPLDLAVGENGAGWAYRQGDMLRYGYFHDAEARASQRQKLEGVRTRVLAECPWLRVASDQPGRRCDLAFDIGEEVRSPRPQIAHAVHAIEATGVRTSLSTVHVHAIPGDWDKASGTRRAFQDVFGLPLPRERYVFVGDSPNDEPAFSWFPHSVGVANVRGYLPHMSSPPRFVTRNERGRGFAEVVSALVPRPERGEPLLHRTNSATGAECDSPNA